MPTYLYSTSLLHMHGHGPDYVYPTIYVTPVFSHHYILEPYPIAHQSLLTDPLRNNEYVCSREFFLRQIQHLSKL